jgi:hypothetical protein
MNESSTTTVTQVRVETMNMPQQVVRELSKTHSSDEDASSWSNFLPPPQGLQRWVSESERALDSSPTPPMSGHRRGDCEGHHLNHMDKQRRVLSSRPVLCSDDDDCAAPPPLLQRWTSQRWSSEWEGTLDKCPAPPSCSLRRWASESCVPASNKSAALLSEVLGSESDEENQPPLYAVGAMGFGIISSSSLSALSA